MTTTIRSKTPCPECGGTRWRRWAWVWPLLEGDPDAGRWLPVDRVPWTVARVDWLRCVAKANDYATGFDICTRCGLVVR